MQRIYVLVSVLLFSFLFGCQKEVSFFGGPDNPDVLPAPDPISAVIQGNVLNEAGAPEAGVMVQVGNQTVLTDSKGYFRLTGAALDKKASVVTATKQGYFKGYRTFSATSGTNQVVIKLLKKTMAGSVSGATGGEVTLSNGSKVALPANGIVTAAGNSAYTGTVNVYATYIDPTAQDINQIVPGSFLAEDKDGKRVLMASFGMLAVELESGSGEKLQIKSGSAATLTTAIPASLQSKAPATIALWSVDEASGIWKEEGTATKNGSVYVGEVKHFSFWNCDVAVDAHILTLTIKNSEGAPLVNTAVRLKAIMGEGVTSSYGYTDSLGQVSGYVPGNRELTMDVLDECEAPFYTQTIPALNKSTNLGVVTVANTGSAVVTLKGKLLNCSNAPVTNGFAIVTYGIKVRYVPVNATGDFQTTITRCSSSPATVDIVGVDNAAQQQGNASTVNVSVPLTTVGTLSACGTSTEQFIDYTLDGVNHRISTAVAGDSLTAFTRADSIQGFNTYFSGFQIGGSKNVTLNFSHTTQAAGTYAANSVSAQTFQTGLPIAPFNVVLTKFPAVAGQFYEGSFTGSFRDASSATHTLSGTFKLRRVF